MISFPNCKINIGLSIIEKREDGFHNIESLFIPVPFYDILEINKSEDLIFESTGINIPGDINSNLCVKAWELIKSDYNISNVSIHLHKQIPIGGGLGGGSADAAFTIKMLSEIFNLHLSISEMEKYAAVLGSDCAFFIKNTAAIATSRGEVLNPINIDLSDYILYLVFPGIHVSTSLAYSGVVPSKKENKISELLKSQLSNWKNTIVNDFELSVFNKFPELEEIKLNLYSLGAEYASMSGSGSTMFGLFKKNFDISVLQSKIKGISIPF